MNEQNESMLQRRALLTGMGVAATGMCLTGTSASAAAGGFQPARHAQDAWLDEMPGSHRVFVDASSLDGGATALHLSRNILNAHQSAYDGKDSDYAMILCFRHGATALGFGDSAWKKFGKELHKQLGLTDPLTGEAPEINLMQVTDRRGMSNKGATIGYVQSRGVQIAVCSAATRGIAGFLSGAGHGEADDIYKELVDTAIPGSRFVSAGVMAVTRAQEYNYSVLVAG
jgi:hypothetical protein